MQTRIIDGKIVAAEVRAEIATSIMTLGRAPRLTAILAGSDPASELYVSLKEKACQEVGLRFGRIDFGPLTTQTTLLETIQDLNADPDIDGILIQLPLPASIIGLDTDAVIAAIDPAKDADGFHPENVRAFLEGSGESPPLAASIRTLAERSGLALAGMQAAVLANSAAFAGPVRRALELSGATVEIALDPDAMAKAAPNADLIVTAIGRPGWLTPDLVRLGAAVIDVGTTRVDGRLRGDADFEALQGVASAITPVPGGVGPVTVAMLLRSVVRLAIKRTSR